MKLETDLLTKEQSVAIAEIINWFKVDSMIKKFWRLKGKAGTGKTSLIKVLLTESTFIQKNQKVAVIAPTHAAARVLRSKGVPAQTIHSLIYRVEELPDGTMVYHRKSKDEIKYEYSLLVVDEASMCDSFMRNDILAFEIPVLFVGDAGQLPPVSGTSDDKKGLFMQEAESSLNEIHRNAGPIANLADLIRNGQMPRKGKFGEGVFVMEEEDLTSNLLLSSDQLIVGKNTTRSYYNKYLRKLKGIDYRNLPAINEKVIVLQNSYDQGIFNGTILESMEDNNTTLIRKTSANLNIKFSYINEFNVNTEVKFKPYFPCIEDLEGEKVHIKINNLIKVDFAYAITCHKAQGSSFEKPIVISEKMGDREFMKKWNYTAITRAESKIIICL